MSWYNSDDTSFIDATQTFSGGGSLEVTGGGGADIQLSDVLELKLDHYENEYEEPQPTLVNNLYLKNNNTGGEIRFLTKEAENNNDVSNNALKYNVKIGTDGKLYLYYTYNPLISALIFSGWTDVIDYIVGNRQATINNGASIATSTTLLQSQITALAVELDAIDTKVVLLQTTVGENILAIVELQLESSRRRMGDGVEDVLDGGAQNAINQTRQRLNETRDGLVESIRGAPPGTDVINATRNISATRFKLIGDIAQSVIGGGVVAGFIGLLYFVTDVYKKEVIRKDINNAMRVLEEAKNDPDKSIVDKIYLQGLQIDQTTNNGFVTAGTYDNIDAGNSGKLTIEITSGLLAEIKSVDDHSTGGFSIGDVITIPKSSIGGSTGNLLINVTAVASVVELLELQIIASELESKNLDVRIRRRQFIPDKDEFGNGLNVTQTFTTEPSGEQLSQLDISLKLDTSQFQYDASGNLQIQNYGTIPVNASQFQYTSGNLELINYSQIATNATDISTNTR
jgi:hypothetical protein